MYFIHPALRAVAKALMGGGGGGVYSYIRVMPDGILLKSAVFKLVSKEISRADHEYMNIHPPLPPQLESLGNTTATSLKTCSITIAFTLEDKGDHKL